MKFIICGFRIFLKVLDMMSRCTGKRSDAHSRAISHCCAVRNGALKRSTKHLFWVSFLPVLTYLIKLSFFSPTPVRCKLFAPTCANVWLRLRGKSIWYTDVISRTFKGIQNYVWASSKFSKGIRYDVRVNTKSKNLTKLDQSK